MKIRLAPRLNAGQVTEPYRLMDEVIRADRQDLQDILIGIAWHTGWRPDADGVRTHGKCMKRTDLDREINGYDFLIVLNAVSWKAFNDKDKRRLIKHELSHAQVCRDANGDVKLDDKGRIVTRIRKHDFADFRDIVEEFGLPPCLSDLQINDADRPLLALAESNGASTDLAADTEEDKPAEDNGLAEGPESKELPSGLAEGPESGELPSGLEWGDQECTVSRDGELLAPKTIDVKLAGIRNAHAYIEWGLARTPGGIGQSSLRWYGGLNLKLGNHEMVEHPNVCAGGFPVLGDLFRDLGERADAWFADIPGDRAADRKRRDQMDRQVSDTIAYLSEKRVAEMTTSENCKE